jgi:uncharacterized membrane protein (UPF0127 family)
VTIWNATRDACLAEHGRVADTFWTRFRGLLGTHELAAGHGLLIESCSSIHSFGMQYPFDALFQDRDRRVIHLISAMPPNRMSRHLFSAKAVLELPAGTIAATGTQRGDQLRIAL